MVPQGSKDPNNRVLGPKYYIISGIWALKPYYLGPWTLRGSKNTSDNNNNTSNKSENHRNHNDNRARVCLCAIAVTVIVQIKM